MDYCFIFHTISNFLRENLHKDQRLLPDGTGYLLGYSEEDTAISIINHDLYPTR